MSSKRRLRKRSCTGKIRHKNRDDAFAHARVLGFDSGCRPYKCKFCKGWHIGRPTKQTKNAIKKRFGL